MSRKVTQARDSMINLIAAILSSAAPEDRADIVAKARRRAADDAPEMLPFWALVPPGDSDRVLDVARKITAGLSRYLTAGSTAAATDTVADLLERIVQTAPVISGDPTLIPYDCALHIRPLGGDASTVLGNIGKGLWKMVTGEDWDGSETAKDLGIGGGSNEDASSSDLAAALEADSAVIQNLQEQLQEAEINAMTKRRQLAALNWAQAILGADGEVADALADVSPSASNLVSLYDSFNKVLEDAQSSENPARVAAASKVARTAAKKAGLSWDSVKRLFFGSKGGE